MLAKAFQGILPELSTDELFEVASIHSVAGVLGKNISSKPPFRAPHHTSSHVAIVGGGSSPRPGEITLARRGVLFMDEFPEFDKRVLESLREPLEEGSISVSRARGRATFPARFILVAALNPCPCGNFGNTSRQCICSPLDIERYKKKLSGPIMDRIDMWVEVSSVPYDDLHKKAVSKDQSTELRDKVTSVSGKQKDRALLNKSKATSSSALTSKDIEDFIVIAPEVRSILDSAANSLGLSPRSYFKSIKLARTIADIENSEEILVPHMLEALNYRPKI